MKTTAFRIGILLAAVILLALWAAPAQGEGPLDTADAPRQPRPRSCERPHHLLGSLPMVLGGDTTGKGDDVDLGAAGDCAGGGVQYPSTGLGEDDVYVMATDTDCPIALSMTPEAGVDLALYVISPDCSDVAGNCVFVDDAGTAGAAEELEFMAYAGQYYRIVVDGFGGQSGNFDLVIESSGECRLADRYGWIGDLVWSDANGDGLQDPEETDPVVGQVALYQCGGLQIDHDSLDIDGSYMFGGLIPGEYFVEFSTPPPGYEFSPQDQGPDDTADSDVDPGTGRTPCFQAEAAVLDMKWDAGMMPATLTLGDRVWYDRNHDGIQDGGEPGLRDITVHLHDNGTCQGSPYATHLTDAAGIYTFGGLAPGTYCLNFADGVIFGWGVSPANQGGDDAVDSDPLDHTWRVENINLQDDDSTVDAGMFVHGRVSGGVWCDQNGNGIHESPAEDVGGVTVRLHADTNCDSQPDSLQSSQDTTADGAFAFYSLHTGPPGGPPLCYVAQVDVGDMGTCNQALTPTSYPAALQADNAIFHLAIFGFREAAALSLGDRVWFDTDHDGLQENGEYGLPNIGVELYASAGCQGSPAASATTDGAGLYLFGGLSPGTYCLSFQGSIPAGLYITAPNNGSDDSLDSDLDQSTRLIDNISLSADDLTRDAGLQAAGRIEGRVYCDHDADGVFDNGEGVDGVTVSLFKDDNCNTVAGSPLDSRVTASQGFYSFNPVFVGPPGGPPLCHLVQVDVGDMGACDVAVTPVEQSVALTADNSEALYTDFGFVELPHAITHIYLPLVLRNGSAP